MNKYKNIIIGFGKGGKTLAKEIAMRGEEVLMIEESELMYGGTCINVGCIPSKSLIINGEKHIDMSTAHSIKNSLTSKLREKNYNNLFEEENITILNGKAKFLSDKIIQITKTDNTKIQVKGERIFINTGSKAIKLPIDGLNKSKNVLDSTTAMEQVIAPEKIVIIGAGYIGLEFASMFNSYGSKVSILDASSEFLPREDEDISTLIYKDFLDKGIDIQLGVSINHIIDKDNYTEVIYTQAGKIKKVEVSKLLVATGRKPNTDALGLENTNIKTDSHGAIVVDEFLKTSVENIWAIGDVKGGLQFTYISLDDYRIIVDYLYGDKKRNTMNRGNIPYSVFITPPFSSVGIKEKELEKSKVNYKVFSLPVKAIPKAHIIDQTVGIFKVIIDAETEKILGASLYGAESHELINLISLAMDFNMDYKVLRDRVYTDPTMSESLNDLLK